jgi:hypothetical protein
MGVPTLIPLTNKPGQVQSFSDSYWRYTRGYLGVACSLVPKSRVSNDNAGWDNCKELLVVWLYDSYITETCALSTTAFCESRSAEIACRSASFDFQVCRALFDLTCFPSDHIPFNKRRLDLIAALSRNRRRWTPEASGRRGLDQVFRSVSGELC